MTSRSNIGLLHIVVVIQCIGLGGRYLFSEYESESDVYGWLYFDRGWDEALAQMIDNVGVLGTVVAGVLLCVCGFVCSKVPDNSNSATALRLLHHLSAIWIASWMVLIALAHMQRASAYGELVIAEQAVRFSGPLALLFFGIRQKSGDDHSRSSQVGIGLLVIAATATFVAHGYIAIQHHPPFADLILVSNANWTKFALSQATAEQLLIAIGWLDILVAVLLLVLRSRLAAAYMAIWGLIAAASRVTAYGLDAWPEVLLRAGNGGVPLVIAVYWSMTRRHPEVPVPSASDSES